MSDEGEPKQQAAEAAKIRRRWITLGETLAVAAVVISALTLWNNYSERTDAAAEKAAERAAEAKAGEAAAGAIVLGGRVEEDGEALVFTAPDEDRAIQSLVIRFPAALGLAPIETLDAARIEADAIARTIRRETEAKTLRVPVLVTTRFTTGGRLREANGLYRIGLERRDRVIGSDAIRFTGLAYQGAGDEDALERAWAAAGS